MTWISYLFDIKYDGEVPIAWICNKCGIIYDTKQIGVDTYNTHFYSKVRRRD